MFSNGNISDTYKGFSKYSSSNEKIDYYLLKYTYLLKLHFKNMQQLSENPPNDTDLNVTRCGDFVVFREWYKTRGYKRYSGYKFGKIVQKYPTRMTVELYNSDCTQSYSITPVNHVNIILGPTTSTGYHFDITKMGRIIGYNTSTFGVKYVGPWHGETFSYEYYCD